MIYIEKFKNPKTEKKINLMEKSGFNITNFIEWAILNFDVEIYKNVMRGK